MRAFLFRGASPRRTPLHTRSRGPHDPRSARVAHSHPLVRAAHGWIKRVSAMVAVAAIMGSSTVFACPVCFAAEETTMINGTKIGVFVLLAITLAVQGAFVGFFLYLRKRAKHIADVELDTEWSELQRATR